MAASLAWCRIGVGGSKGGAGNGGSSPGGAGGTLAHAGRAGAATGVAGEGGTGAAIQAHPTQDCAASASSCDAEWGAYKNSCENVGVGADSCVSAQNGNCDEPNVCAPSTDTSDCGDSNRCRLAFDGHCDEGGECAAGTDTYDCTP